MHKHLISEEWPAKNYGTFVFRIVPKNNSLCHLFLLASLHFFDFKNKANLQLYQIKLCGHVK